MKKGFSMTLAFMMLASAYAHADGRGNFDVNVQIDIAPPATQAAYDNLWHNEDITINLTASDTGSGIGNTYYSVNGGPVQTVMSAGQPIISSEGADNRLEYWSVDKAGNVELPHNELTSIKLDKTAPMVNIAAPADEAAFDSGPITVSGTVNDSLSGPRSLEIIVGNDSYNAAVQSDGSFSVSNINIYGGQNALTAMAHDAAGNEGADGITVFLGWVLHLQVPYYAKTQDYYSGSACCQIILNYIRNGLAAMLTQDEIYNYGHPRNYGENSAILEMDPQAVDYALGHFDPYDTTDPTGQGNIYKAYNFDIEVFANSDFNKYLRDIIHWMAYPVTIDEWWLNGQLAAWPNTPVATPVYGTYDHWVVVNGAATTQNPVPEPHTRPGYTPDFTVYGLWLTDPAGGGIGRDVYVVAQSAKDTYLRPLETSDSFNGKYLHVAEPPPAENEAEAAIAAPKINDETRRIVEIAEKINTPLPEGLPEFEKRAASAKKHLYDAALVVNIKDAPDGAGRGKNADQPPRPESVFNADERREELDWKKIIDSAILTDEKFRDAFDNAQARSFIKVKRADQDNSFYYLIPFDKYTQGRFLTCAAIIIDSQDGSFKEASWVDTPARFVQIDRQKAAEILFSKYPNLRNSKFDFELIWKPGGISDSPFYPYWRAASKERVYYITQNKEVVYDAW